MSTALPASNTAPVGEAPRRWRLDQRTFLAAAAGFALLLLLGMSVGKWWAFQRVADAVPRIAQMATIESHLNRIDRDVLAIQAARRGFVITNDENQARRVERIAADLPTQFERLRRSLVAAEAQDKDIAEMWRAEALAEAHVRSMLMSLAEHRADPRDDVRQRLHTLAGEVAIEAVHASLKTLEESVEVGFRADMANLTGAMHQAQWLELVLLLGATVTIAGALWLARGEIVQREAALADVMRQRALLEDEVQRRTVDLSASLRRYRNLVELSDDAILLCGADRRIRYANAAAEGLLAELGQDPPTGRELQALFGGSQRERLLEALDAVWCGGLKLGFTAGALQAGQGGESPVEVAASGYEDGAETYVLFVLHDLREQRAQEAALRDQLEFIEQLVEAVPLPLSLRDTEGRLRLVNRAFEAFHGVDRSDVTGRAIAEVLPPDAARVLASHDDRVPHAEASDFEGTVTAGGAATRIVHVRQRAIHQRDPSWEGVLCLETDVTALRRQELDLREHGERLGVLAAQLIAAQEEERRRVARELHDHVGQILTALRMQLASAVQLVPAAAVALRGPIDLAEEALAHTRDLTAKLHPHVLDDLGLTAALGWLIKRYVQPSLPEVHFDCRLDPERADPTIELVAFRVVQEALTNTLRHAQASCAEVRLSSREGWLQIDAADDGRGFALGDTWFDGGHHRSVGMSSMRERVEDLGGDFAVDSAPGRGTQLRVLLPWPRMAIFRRGVDDAGFAG